MPQRENSKSDLGNTKRASDSYDVNNCFLTEQGWFYRHFKGDPTDPNVRYWDEIIVAGTAEGEQAIPYSTETSEGSLLVTTPGYEDGPDTKFDVTYGSAVDHDSTINIVPPGPDPVGYAQFPPYVGQAPGGGGGDGGDGGTGGDGGGDGGGTDPTPPPTTIGTVTVTGNESPAENSTETYSFTISGDASGYASIIATDVPGATAIQPNQIQFGAAGGGGNVNFIISDANSSDDGAYGSLVVTPVAAGGGGGGGTGGAVDSIEINDPTGGAESPTGDYTFSASQTGSGTGTTYAWTATGDASIVGDATQSSAVVHFTWTDGHGSVSVEVTSTENGTPETLTETTEVSVEKPVPVIGQVTPTLTSSSPIIAGNATTWLAATTLGLDSGPVESSEAEWTISDSGATIADENSTSPTITFSAAGTYDVTARVRQRNDMGWGEWVEGTSSAPVNAAGGGTGGTLDSIDIADPTAGAPTEGFQTVTFTASNTGGDTGATYAWTVTGDGEINGASDQASVNVDLEWTGGNNDANENGVATVSVAVTASDASETINQSTAVTVLKPLPVIGTVTVTSVTDPVLATVESEWKTIVSQGIDSGPTESENTVWSVSPNAGVTIVQDGTNRATITFPDTQAYEVTAELVRTNSRGDSDPGVGTATQTPGAAPVPPTPSDTYTYSVVVNGNNKYELTGESLTDAEAPTLTIKEKDNIVFRQGDASNAGHPIRVYRNADKSGLPVISLSQVGTAGDGGANTGTIYTAVDGAGTYYYQCENHANMGGTIIVNA